MKYRVFAYSDCVLVYPSQVLVNWTTELVDELIQRVDVLLSSHDSNFNPHTTPIYIMLSTLKWLVYQNDSCQEPINPHSLWSADPPSTFLTLHADRFGRPLDASLTKLGLKLRDALRHILFRLKPMNKIEFYYL